MRQRFSWKIATELTCRCLSLALLVIKNQKTKSGAGTMKTTVATWKCCLQARAKTSINDGLRRILLLGDQTGHNQYPIPRAHSKELPPRQVGMLRLSTGNHQVFHRSQLVACLVCHSRCLQRTQGSRCPSLWGPRRHRPHEHLLLNQLLRFLTLVIWEACKLRHLALYDRKCRCSRRLQSLRRLKKTIYLRHWVCQLSRLFPMYQHQPRHQQRLPLVVVGPL